jgi:hypothetical protein
MGDLMTLFNVDGIFCDALVSDDQDSLIFASLWGRDTAIQELLARLTLSAHEGGIADLVFKDQSVSGLKTVHLNDKNRLDKLTGRMPKANILGDMAQLMLFDKLVQAPDYANRKGYLLFDGRPMPKSNLKGANAGIYDLQVTKPVSQISNTDHGNGNQIWHTFKSICHLPMLDRWQHRIERLLKTEGWMTCYPGFNANVIAIDLPEIEFDDIISEMIVAGELTL